MPEEPLPDHQPRPAVPLPEEQWVQRPPALDPIIDAQIVDQRPPAPLAPVPVQTINVPDQTVEIPMANVYSPPNAAVPPSMTMNPPGPPPYYPPAYPPYTPPMEYRVATGGSGYGRPPMVTTLAISSIVVASLSIIACIFSGCTGAVVLTNASASRAIAYAPPPTAAVTPSFPYAMSQPDRQAVYTAVQGKMMKPMSKPRENQFEALLARYGKQIIDDPEGAPLTAQRVSSHIVEAKQQFAGPGRKGPDTVVLQQAGKLQVTPGTFEISDDLAVFRFKDNTQTLRFALKSTDSIEPATPPANPFGLPDTNIASGLDDSEARAVVSRVNVLSNNNLNSLQNSTLTSLLKSPSSANFIAPSSTIPGLTAQVKSSVVNNDNSITINFTQGPLTLDVNGQVSGAANVTWTPATMPAGAVNPFGTFTVNPSSCKLAITESILSLLLAGLLMTCGVLALRQSAMTRRLYLIWAVAKLAMAVLGIVALRWMLSSMQSTSSFPAFADMMSGWTMTALWLGIAGAIFPLIVLGALLLSKSMREYFTTAG